MISTPELIIAAGALIIIAGALGKLLWKWIMIAGLLICAFGIVNVIFQWVK